jgi:hypothetical protein
MKSKKLPTTDSIQKLARFWDTHDLTDFENELVEVTEPVYEKGASIRLNLKSREAKAVRQLPESKGISENRSEA